MSFRGRGYLHLTGRWNYANAGKDLGYGNLLVENPDIVATDPEIGAATAIWYWKKRVAPRLSEPLNVKQATKAINPGETKPRAHVSRKEKVQQQHELIKTDPALQGVSQRSGGDR
jgi:predicted chitinase